jgi:hypothetical protein
MRQQYGKALIGCEIYTQAVGEYPGGWAKVTHIDYDPAAPEIPITVEHPEFGTMGIFENEVVYLRTSSFEQPTALTLEMFREGIQNLSKGVEVERLNAQRYLDSLHSANDEPDESK